MNETDLTPLSVSVTVAENVAEAPIVEPEPGVMYAISGGVESSPLGGRA